MMNGRRRVATPVREGLARVGSRPPRSGRVAWAAQPPLDPPAVLLVDEDEPLDVEPPVEAVAVGV